MPAWTQNGQELFYLEAGTAMMGVPVQTAANTFIAGNPTKLFEGPWFATIAGRTYDMSRDGRRFLMIKNPPATGTAVPKIALVLNWVEELKRGLPANR
jgi:hypothetical protein